MAAVGLGLSSFPFDKPLLNLAQELKCRTWAGQITREISVLQDLETGLIELQSQLDQLIDCARQNELMLQRIHQLETNLLSLSSLKDLIELSLAGARTLFALDHVGLTLVDDTGDLRCLLSEEGLDIGATEGLLLIDHPETLLQVFGKAHRAYLGPCRVEHRRVAFRKATLGNAPASAALLPLVRRQQLLGSLNFGSADANHFKIPMATDFLERLSSVLGVCLENTLNFERLRRASLCDILTGVNNRRFFDQRVVEEIDRVMRSGECLSCMFLDIDYFKRINDTHGHQSGDQVLVNVANLVRSTLRSNDLLARYGGEEFVALLSLSSERKTMEIAERIRTRIAANEFLGKQGQKIRVTISIGIAVLDPARHAPSGKISADTLIGLADRALYRAKGGGRNRVVSAGLVGAGSKSPRPINAEEGLGRMETSLPLINRAGLYTGRSN